MIVSLQILRPGRWYKNILIILGSAMACKKAGIYYPDGLSYFAIGVMSGIFLSSANYILNEWLDAMSDRYHPVKERRTLGIARYNQAFLFSLYAFFALLGSLFAFGINRACGIIALVFLLFGIIYNVRPIRAKDVPFLDILTDSVTSPLRFLLGWLIVLPVSNVPVTLLIGLWTGAGYFMGLKRVAEIGRLPTRQEQERYRKSFQFYDREKLTGISSLLASLSFVFTGGYVLFENNGFWPALPCLGVLFVWYFQLAMKKDSIAVLPEWIYKDKLFVLYCLAFFLLVLFL